MSKRGNIFAQGRPETPYEDRSDDGGDTPQRATAAQLATRKIKSAKARPRPTGASSVSSQSANFSTPLPNFNFGASTPAPSNNTTNPFNFGGNTAFGATTNSFPPAQSSAPSNSFVNSSFPAFGANSQNNISFNPQPATSSFNFTTGGSNPFATSASTPALNGTTSSTPAFGAFGTQPASNPFGALGQNITTASAPGGLFSTTSGPSQTSLFGTAASSAPIAATTPASAAPPFFFSSSAQNTASAPATSNPFGGLNTITQPATPAPNNIFGGFTASAQKNETAAPTNNLYGGFGTSAQAVENSTSTAPAKSLFSFGSTAQTPDAATTTTAPSTNLFTLSGATAPTPSAPAITTASNPFANLPTAPSTSTSILSPLSTTPQTPQPQVPEKTPAMSNNFLANLKPVEPSASTVAETPKPNPFASLGKPNSNPAATPAAASPGFSNFGAFQNKDTASGSTVKSSAMATLKAPEASKSNLFNGFSTPQPAKTADAVTPQGGLFSAAQPKMSSGIFSQTFKPDNAQSGNLSKPQSMFSLTGSTASTEAKNATLKQPSQSEPSNPFSKLGTPSAERPNLFTAAKEPAPASPSFSMPTLTGAAVPPETTSRAPELPKVPKVHVPKDWALASAVRGVDSIHQHISDLTAQLQTLNERYRQQLNKLPLAADWSSLSLWHYQYATEIKQKIDSAKKQHAAAKGITGNESALSTKRKVNDQSPDARDATPSKRARAAGAPATPTPQPSVSPPRANPLPTSTSNMFAKAIGNKPSTPSASTNASILKTTEKPHVDPPKAAAPATGFTPSLPAFNGFSSSKTTSASTGFNPNLGGGSTGGGFFNQFSKTAKSYEELAAERKAKAMAEDYDSDDETEEEWSTRYDKKEAERLAEEKKEVAAAPKFNLGGSSKPPGNSAPSSNPFTGLAKPTSGASSTGLFNSRVGSPALSTGGQSVFDAPSNAQTPSSNIFGHLSSGPSSSNQDESDDDNDEKDGEVHKKRPVDSVASTTPPKRKFGDSETESEETLEEMSRRKTQAIGSKGSLLSRMTRDDGDGAESEKENSNAGSIFGQTNGAQTPTAKPLHFFDFDAAGSGSTTPKPVSFAGDHTFKPGTPIKFETAPATETKSAAPKFVFQPATPLPAEFSTTPARAPPSSLFNLAPSTSGSSLFAPNAGFSSAASVTSSVFSSRAGTPLSEAENSTASAAEEEEEGGKQEQVDLSQLTEEEKDANDIVFHAEVVLAKHQIDKGDGSKTWANLAKGPLWILKDKVTAKSFIRIRIPSGAAPLDYRLLPAIQATITGSSKKMVMATKPAKEGGLQQVLYAVKTPDIAEEFARKYNESLPSN